MSDDRDAPLSVRWQEIINTVNDNRQPTEQAAFAFFAALLHVIEERHGISLLPPQKKIHQELEAVVNTMLRAERGDPLYVHDKDGLRQMHRLFQECMN